METVLDKLVQFTVPMRETCSVQFCPLLQVSILIGKMCFELDGSRAPVVLSACMARALRTQPVPWLIALGL